MKTNEDHQVDIIGNYLNQKEVALCVTGGIAAIETPKIARHLRRYGARVKAYVTNESQKFIGKAALEWGTGQDVVSELSGKSEHLCREDVVLVAPATTNTINKIFSGIADNPVTTLIASALGMGKPVYLAPTMHESLYHNPFLQNNLAQAKDYGVIVLPPRLSEGKAKMPKLEEITARLSQDLSEDPIRGKRILITAGPTPVKIDAVRRITNKFRGTLGKLIAQEAYLRGAEVKLLMGDTGISVPEYLDVKYHRDLDQYINNVFQELGANSYDIGIFSAAVADFKPREVYNGKFSSKEQLHLEFEHTLKVIKAVREKYPDLYMATFKYERGISQEELLDIAHSHVSQGYQLVVANREEDYSPRHEHQAYIVDSSGVLGTPQNKTEIAQQLINFLGEKVLVSL